MRQNRSHDVNGLAIVARVAAIAVLLVVRPENGHARPIRRPPDRTFLPRARANVWAQALGNASVRLPPFARLLSLLAQRVTQVHQRDAEHVLAVAWAPPAVAVTPEVVVPCVAFDEYVGVGGDELVG